MRRMSQLSRLVPDPTIHGPRAIGQQKRGYQVAGNTGRITDMAGTDTGMDMTTAGMAGMNTVGTVVVDTGMAGMVATTIVITGNG